MAIPAIVGAKLSQAALNLLPQLLAGIFGGLFGGDPKPNLPAGLKWTHSPILGSVAYKKPKEAPTGPGGFLGGSGLHMGRGGLPDLVVLNPAVGVTGDAIRDEASGLVVAVWDKDRGVTDVIGYTLEGIPISGHHEENAVYHGQPCPVIDTPDGPVPDPWMFLYSQMKVGAQGRTVPDSAVNPAIQSLQSKAGTWSATLFGTTSPVGGPVSRGGSPVGGPVSRGGGSVGGTGIGLTPGLNPNPTGVGIQPVSTRGGGSVPPMETNRLFQLIALGGLGFLLYKAVTDG